MHDHLKILKALAAFVLAACAAIYGESQPEPMVDPALATLGSGFLCLRRKI
jgi:hypothetical protein